jgi:hypothetical protein
MNVVCIIRDVCRQSRVWSVGHGPLSCGSGNVAALPSLYYVKLG